MPKVLNFADPKMKAKYIAFREFLHAYKMERGCSRCGWAEHPAALDFDHVDPNDKDQKLACMFSYSKEKVEAELAKCVVLCSNCHRIKTWEEGQFGPRFYANGNAASVEAV